MNRLNHWAIPMVALAGITAASFAQGPAPAPAAPPKVVPVVRASFASFDAADKLIADLGIPIPSAGLLAKLESAPFIGQGSIASDKPVGLLILMGDAEPLMPAENHMLVAIPAVEGKLTAADLKAKGATPVQGQAEIMTMGQSRSDSGTFRRTASYLFAKPNLDNASGLADVTDTLFAADYKQPGTLAMAALDLAAFRKAAPNNYKALFAMAAMMMPQAPDADPAAPSPLQAGFDKIDRLTLAIAQDEKNLRLQSWVTPYAGKAVQPTPRPAFPAGMIFQGHIVYPDAQTAGQLETQLDMMSAQMLRQMPPDQQAPVKSIMKRVAKLNSQSDAISLAVGKKNDKFVIYIVDQFNKDLDLAAELKATSEDVAALAKVAGGNVKSELSTYDAGGKTVQRLMFTGSQPDEKLAIDGVQNGKVLYIAVDISDDSQNVAELASLGMKGQSTMMGAASLDLEALLAALPVPPEMATQLKPGFAGQAITWTAQVSVQGGNYRYAELLVPKQVIRETIKVYSRMMSGAGPQGGPGQALP